MRIFDCFWQYSSRERPRRFWPDHRVLAHCPKAHCCTRSCTLLASTWLKFREGPEDDLEIAHLCCTISRLVRNLGIPKMCSEILRLCKFLDCAEHTHFIVIGLGIWHRVWIIQQYCTSSNSLRYWILKIWKLVWFIYLKAVVCWSGCIQGVAAEADEVRKHKRGIYKSHCSPEMVSCKGWCKGAIMCHTKLTPTEVRVRRWAPDCLRSKWGGSSWASKATCRENNYMGDRNVGARERLNKKSST